ncbi:DgyrCDS3499 [Dimorphilus gyrociliatus]|uniref:DgyrCDS3499 n=1 Tax=Dimorphilus gyrociliatus TaxID=2664684 RepID=A0A7I8VDE9_9ANNE|nr:DgyrCDS3499 [Dimorphilus gyrociliatus]
MNISLLMNLPLNDENYQSLTTSRSIKHNEINFKISWGRGHHIVVFREKEFFIIVLTFKGIPYNSIAVVNDYKLICLLADETLCLIELPDFSTLSNKAPCKKCICSSSLEASDLGKQRNAINMTCNSHGKQFLVFLLLSDKEIALKCFTLLFDNDEYTSLSLLYKIPRTTSSIANIRGTPFTVVFRQTLNENLAKQIVPESSKCEESLCLYSYHNGVITVNESIHKKEDILHFLNQDCIAIITLDLKSRGDCLVLIGNEGKVVYLTCEKNSLMDRTFFIPGPILCCDFQEYWLFYSNHERLYKVNLLRQLNEHYTPFDIEYISFYGIRRLHIVKVSGESTIICVHNSMGNIYKLEINKWDRCEPSDISALLNSNKNFQDQTDFYLEQLDQQNSIIRNLTLCYNCSKKNIKITLNKQEIESEKSVCISVINNNFLDSWFVVCTLKSLQERYEIQKLRKASSNVKFYFDKATINEIKPYKINIMFFFNDSKGMASFSTDNFSDNDDKDDENGVDEENSRIK